MAAHHLNILTFNLSVPSTPNITALHISTLNSEAPNTDLFCLQNVSQSEFKAILPAFPYFEGSMGHRSGHAIFVRRSIFEVLQFIDHDTNSSFIHVVHKASNKIIEIWSLEKDYSSIDKILSGYAQIICGQITNIPKRPTKYVNLLRKVGNFESTHPYSKEKVQTGILVQGLKPISGDVLDMGLWKIKDEENRVQRLLELTGSDYFPVKASVGF